MALVAEARRQLDLLDSLRRLSDADLLSRVRELVARERGATAQLVAHLAELDTRDLHLRAGFPSLFAYCRDALGLSEAEAYTRIEVARAVRRFPVILPMLLEGTLQLTAARLLAPHLTPENHLRLLEATRGKRKAEVEELVARLRPLPDAAASIRKLPVPRPAPPTFPASPGSPTAPAEKTAPSPETNSAPLVASAGPPRPSVAPLSPDRYRFQLTISGDVLEKLRLARDLLRHAIPTGDDEALLDRALTSLLADLARMKFAATEHPRSARGGPPGPESRHIPAEVKRTVWLRDLGRCAFVSPSGRRCDARAFVEFHHVKPWAVGGEAVVENIELRCRSHNAHEARVYFGREDGGAGEVREGGRAYVTGRRQLVPEQVG